MTQEQMEAIKEMVSDELLKRGFNVEVKIDIDERGYVDITSNDFQTTPVLYKRLFIYGGGRIEKEETIDSLGEKVMKYYTKLSVNVRTESFSGGFNAIYLFDLNLVWLNDYSRVKLS